MKRKAPEFVQKTKAYASFVEAMPSDVPIGQNTDAAHTMALNAKVRSMQNFTIEKDNRLRKFHEIVTKYYDAFGLTGIIFHDKNGKQIPVAESDYSFRHTARGPIHFKNIDLLWKTEWTVVNENGQFVSYEDSPFMKALHSGKTCKEILNIRMKDGELYWLYFHSQPVQAGNTGESHCVVSNIVDITGEKRVIDKTEKREIFLKSFTRQLPSLAWVVNEYGELLFANPAFYKYFRLKEKTSLGHRLVELVPPSVSSKFYDKHIKVLNSGTALQTIEHIKFVDGTDFNAYVSILPIDGVDGKRVIIGHSLQLPDKTQPESKFQGGKRELLMLSYAISDAIWEWDMQSGQIYHNQPLMKMIGYEGERFAGLAWWLRHIYPEDRLRVSQKVKEAAANGEASWQVQYRFLCADGSYKHLQDRGYIIYENGLAVRMIGALTDMTKLKQLEYELTNEKLKRHADVAETVIRAQEMERTRIGHELHDNVNQILSSARLFIDILKPDDEDQAEIKNKGLEYISLAIEEIRKLSKELVVPQLKQQGLAASIRALINDMHVASPVKFSFVYDPDAEYEQIASSKKLTLFRIVQEQVKNILNHSKATAAGICLNKVGGNTELIIWDNGIGFIPRQTHSGIGLSNIRERVSFYNGKVEMQSAPGKGCRLIVTIPMG